MAQLVDYKETPSKCIIITTLHW